MGGRDGSLDHLLRQPARTQPSAATGKHVRLEIRGSRLACSRVRLKRLCDIVQDLAEDEPQPARGKRQRRCKAGAAAVLPRRSIGWFGSCENIHQIKREESRTVAACEGRESAPSAASPLHKLAHRNPG